MDATTYTRTTMPPVPAGKVRLWDFAHGPLPTGLDAEVQPIESAVAAVHSYPVATLAYETRGYVAAGSCMRWQEAHWSVLYWLPDGTRHGRGFTDEAAARAYFAKLTNGAEVSRMRQQDAQRADEAAEIEAKITARMTGIAVTTKKSAIYRNWWSFSADCTGLREMGGRYRTRVEAERAAAAAVRHAIYREITA